MSGLIDVVHGGDIRTRWNGIYVLLSDYNSIQDLSGGDYVNSTFSLFENGFALDLSKHNIVEVD